MPRTVLKVIRFPKPVPYRRAWRLQNRLAAGLAQGKGCEALLLLEHPPTYTFGARGKDAHLLADPASLARQGIEVVRTDRGGDVTFHGPGQLVGYPVLDLGRRGWPPVRYLRALEEVLIRALAPFDIRGERLPGFTGVWAGGAKIAAIGVKVDSRGISTHGFALNVNTDLSFFDGIIPCGIRHKGVTSLAALGGVAVPMAAAAQAVLSAFATVLACRLVTGAARAQVRESFVAGAA